MVRYGLFGALLVFGLGAGIAEAQRTITAADYLDRVRGMWFGQLIANHSGRPFEGAYCTRDAAPDEAFAWVIKTTYEDPWTGDDDTNFEYLYLHALETHGLDITDAEVKAEWDAHVPLAGIYIANRQAKYLMTHGFGVPDTGSWFHNMHAYAIDAQITTETLGALTPGCRQWAIDKVGQFGGVSNDGYSLHAAQAYAAMYAAAAFETDVHTIVVLGQASIPQSSRSWRAIQDVRDWYAADMLDGTPDWRATRELIYEHYHTTYARGRYRLWIESTINLALTTMSLLYGEGGFGETVRIGVLSGYDADCNPATAGGLIGMMVGYDGLPVELTGPATDCYKPLNRPGLPEYDTITGVAARLRAVAEQVIVATGGSVDGGVYTVPLVDPVVTDPEMPDPTGPSGLVAEVLAIGETVTVSASVEDHHSGESDRDDLGGIIDGIVDLRHNGHVPYDTYDGENAQPSGGDYYALEFSVPVRFERLTFHEGDLRWSDINGDPRAIEPRGGYFENLTVEVHRAGGWVPVNGLALSEPLDPHTYYQVIDLMFDPITSTAIRIRGDAGGWCESTTIVELVAQGVRMGDLDGDGDADLADYSGFRQCLAGPDASPPSTPVGCLDAFDSDGDGDVDLADFAVFMTALRE